MHPALNDRLSKDYTTSQQHVASEAASEITTASMYGSLMENPMQSEVNALVEQCNKPGRHRGGYPSNQAGVCTIALSQKSSKCRCSPSTVDQTPWPPLHGLWCGPDKHENSIELQMHANGADHFLALGRSSVLLKQSSGLGDLDPSKAIAL